VPPTCRPPKPKTWTLRPGTRPATNKQWCLVRGMHFTPLRLDPGFDPGERGRCPKGGEGEFLHPAPSLCGAYRPLIRQGSPLHHPQRPLRPCLCRLRTKQSHHICHAPRLVGSRPRSLHPLRHLSSPTVRFARPCVPFRKPATPVATPSASSANPIISFAQPIALTDQPLAGPCITVRRIRPAHRPLRPPQRACFIAYFRHCVRAHAAPRTARPLNQ